MSRQWNATTSKLAPGAPHADVHFSGQRQRDVLPLPPTSCRSPDGSRTWHSLSRGCQQRRQRRDALDSRIDETRRSVNLLSGVEGHFCESPLSEQQVGVLSHLETCVGHYQPPCDFSPHEALRQLLHTDARYCEGGGESVGDVAPFGAGAVSLPAAAHRAPAVAELLGGEGEVFKRFEESMLRSEEEYLRHIEDVGEPRIHLDPRLKEKKGEYEELVVKLVRLGLLGFTTKPREHVGLFFVWKKDRTLRMICDARRSNARFREPPQVRLATGCAMSRIEIPENTEMFIGSLDLKDYFHTLRIPDEMSDFFCLPAVRCRNIRRRGVATPDTDMAFPCFRSLPMGFSWALWAAQRCHEILVASAGLSDGMRLVDGRVPPDLKDGVVHLEYVDNLVLFGCNEDEVNSALERARLRLEAAGLIPHEVEQAATKASVLGIELDGVAGTARITGKRYWKVYGGIHGLLQRGTCSGDEMRKLLGHLCYVFLLRRCCLSVMSACFKYAVDLGPRRSRLWPSVRRELATAAGVLCLCYARLNLSWSCNVFGSDASMSGVGVGRSEWSMESARGAGRRDERWRFRCVQQGGHRRRALAAAGLSYAWDPGGCEAAWEEVPEFPDVPFSLLGEESWTDLFKYRVDGSVPIHAFEAAGMLSVTKHLSRCSRSGGLRYLALSDNMSAVLGWQKGRCRDFRLLKCLRKHASLCLACDLWIHYRWIPSELNPLDRASRTWEPCRARAAATPASPPVAHGGPLDSRSWRPPDRPPDASTEAVEEDSCGEAAFDAVDGFGGELAPGDRPGGDTSAKQAGGYLAAPATVSVRGGKGGTHIDDGVGRAEIGLAGGASRNETPSMWRLVRYSLQVTKWLTTLELVFELAARCRGNRAPLSTLLWELCGGLREIAHERCERNAGAQKDPPNLSFYRQGFPIPVKPRSGVRLSPSIGLERTGVGVGFGRPLQERGTRGGAGRQGE